MSFPCPCKIMVGELGVVSGSELCSVAVVRVVKAGWAMRGSKVMHPHIVGLVHGCGMREWMVLVRGHCEMHS